MGTQLISDAPCLEPQLADSKAWGWNHLKAHPLRCPAPGLKRLQQLSSLSISLFPSRMVALVWLDCPQSTSVPSRARPGGSSSTIKNQLQKSHSILSTTFYSSTSHKVEGVRQGSKGAKRTATIYENCYLLAWPRSLEEYPTVIWALPKV